MTKDSEKTGMSRLATVFFIACFALAGYFLYLVFRPFFSILVWACLLAVVFQPLFQSILKRVRGHRTAASIIACLVVLVLIILPLTIIGILLTQQSMALYRGIQDNIGDLGGEASARLQEFQQRPVVSWMLTQGMRLLGSDAVSMQSAIQQTLSAISRFIVAKGPSVLAGVGGMLYQFLMMFVTMFFLFRDGSALMEFARSASPLPDKYEVELLTKFRDISYATFFGSILTAIVQGCTGGLLFWALGVSSPLFWAALIALASLLPVVGAFLVWAPVSIYFFMIGSTTRGILVLVLGGLVVSSIDNVLKPMIIRGRTDMHPMLIFLGVLGGMQAFGFLGVLLGPFFIAAFLSFMNFYRIEFRQTLENKIVLKE